MRLLAVSASVLFHPMLMPIYGLFLIFHSGTHISFIPFEYKRMSYAIVFTSSCVLPLTVMILLNQLGLIKTFRLESNRERIVPVFFTGFFYFIGYMVLKRFGLPQFIYQFILASLVALYAALVVTFWWKISLHMIGIGGITGAIVALSLKMGLGINAAFVAFLIASGIVGSARLYLNAHTPMQILVGFLLGCLTVGIIPLL